MISRRSRCVCSASVVALRHFLGEITIEFAAEIGIVRHLAVEQFAVERELGVSEQHREFGPRQSGIALAPLGNRHLVRQELHRRDRARRALPASASAAAGSRDLRGRGAAPSRAPASADNCCASTSRATSSVISASKALRASIVSAPARTGAAERDLDVDLDVGGVDAGGIVDGVGIEPDAVLAPPRCGRAGSCRDWRPRRSPCSCRSAPVMRIASLARSPAASSPSFDARM